jgi:hemerythrin
MKTLRITTGVFWVEIEEANLRILCGCPADAVKHMKKRGYIEEMEKNGIACESGPNAVLLSDVLIQNGMFANLTEFPVLQMLYLQGMILPNHPNNNGTKPMLIGSEETVNSQMEYIFRGNYGLISKEEIMETGISEEQAEEMMRIKLFFAFGKISTPQNLLDRRIIYDDQVELRNGVFIRRLKLNVYEISYKDEKTVINLNLAPHEKYEAPFQLGYQFIKREYFAVIHSGEGDGWDIHRPCMSSIIIFQGKIYLIDAGPNILTTLNYLGISVNEIEGLFHTHVHDDHFAGLTTLIRTDRKLKYYTTPLVRASVTKKLCALMSIKENNFANFFDVYDIPFDEWSNVDGLQVMPVYSPHPVETNCFIFKAEWGNDDKTYIHWADITAFDILDKMTIPNKATNQSAITTERCEEIKALYLQPAHLKKIDVGGGMIHGNAIDFKNDLSHKIVLAHTNKPLTMQQREIGSSAAFGMVDVLIPANHYYNYILEAAFNYLCFYFPNAPLYDIHYLLNHPIKSVNVGSILFKKGNKSDSVYLLLTGAVEYTDSQKGMQHTFYAGSLIGFYAGYLGMNAMETYWAASNLQVLQLPVDAYNEFVIRNNLYSELKKLEDYILFLQETWLFGEVVSFPILTKLARLMQKVWLESNTTLYTYQVTNLNIIIKGEIEIWFGNKLVEKLGEGDFFGGEFNLFGEYGNFEIRIISDTNLYSIDAQELTEIPIVFWKLLETYEKRLRKAGKNEPSLFRKPVLV